MECNVRVICFFMPRDKSFLQVPAIQTHLCADLEAKKLDIITAYPERMDIPVQQFRSRSLASLVTRMLGTISLISLFTTAV